MQRWQRMNVYFSLIGLFVFIISIIFVKKVPVLLLPAAFALGIAFNCFKTIYKKTPPPGFKQEEEFKNVQPNKKNKKKKSKKDKKSKIHLFTSK